MLLGAPGSSTDVFTKDGFVSRTQAGNATLYLQAIPTGPKANEYYRYKGGPNGYSIEFETESDTVYGKANVYYAHASTVDGSDELK